jgi:hypothetical protein
MDGATVYGHKAQANGSSFFFHGHFSKYVGETDPEGAYKKQEEYKNVGRHVVSFYNPQLKKVVSVEIMDKVKILNNGQIHSIFSKEQLMKLPVVSVSTGLKITIPPITDDDLIPIEDH